ncbi:dihydroorotate dehydrogenase [Dehalococcoides mccartyi]|uniref:dihydroorotate dehydrogenase n=1 Tax=Dehalococcoides mccartyi TaxID=61435 RepID=UPI0007867899
MLCSAVSKPYNLGRMAELNLNVDIAPYNPRQLRLSNPVMAASGTFGYGDEYPHLFDRNRLGAIVCKATTLKPREGNPQPRIAETPNGMLNSIGLQNMGVEAVIRDKAPQWYTWDVPVIVNIAAESIEDYAELARRLDKVPGVSGIEVNISCPNVKCGCIEFGSSPESAARVTDVVRNATTLPLIVKLTPNTSSITELAKAVADAGADAISLINTLRGMRIDIKKRRPVLGNHTGGLSGPAIKPVAISMVYQVAGAVNVPVIGGGGIMNAEDALEFLMAGATSIQIGTANLVNPRAPMDILEGLEAYAKAEGLKSIREIVGVARG